MPLFRCPSLFPLPLLLLNLASLCLSFRSSLSISKISNNGTRPFWVRLRAGRVPVKCRSMVFDFFSSQGFFCGPPVVFPCGFAHNFGRKPRFKRHTTRWKMSSWACPACTLKNAGGSECCICKTPKPRTPTPPHTRDTDFSVAPGPHTHSIPRVELFSVVTQYLFFVRSV